MMTPLSLAALLLLVALGSVFSTQGHDFVKEDGYDNKEELARGRRGFSCKKMGSVCFDATHFNVSEIVVKQGFCDNFIGGHKEYGLIPDHRHICPHQHPYCCVNCGTSEQTRFCSRKVKHGSTARRKCCQGELFFGSARLGCRCCKHCKRRPRCRARHGICVNNEDPVFNVTACLNGFPGTVHEGVYRIKKRGCVGRGCFCCEPLNPPTTPVADPADYF